MLCCFDKKHWAFQEVLSGIMKNKTNETTCIFHFIIKINAMEHKSKCEI